MIEVIKFGAEWCNPCKLMKGTMEALMQKYNSENSDVSVLDIDIDKNSEMALEYNVRSIPFIVFKKDGDIVEKLTGVKQTSDIEEVIKMIKDKNELHKA